MKLNRNLVICLAVMLGISGCATDEYGNSRPMTDAEKGALIGAMAGAAIGMTQKDKKGNRAIIIGAAGGALAGGAVGYYMDSQKKDFLKVLKKEVDSGSITIEKLPQDRLRVNMTTATAFDVDSATLKSGYYSTLDKIAKILNKYGKTELLIVGHTDSSGSEKYNLSLSLKRANAVSNYLAVNNVVIQRLNTYGKGESQPIASNSTKQGRRLNRRVEIIIVPIVEEG